MFSKIIITTTISLAALATAAPQPRQALQGVYMCPKANFAAGDNGMACRWRAAANETAGTCMHLHWFGMPKSAERHISFTPDTDYYCTVFEDFNCDSSKPHLIVEAPGLVDTYRAHKQLVGLDSTAQFLSYMCSADSGEESRDQEVTKVY